MEVKALSISDAFTVESEIHSDSRGNFWEWFKDSDFQKKADKKFNPKQVNISVNKEFVIRGIHYSLVESGQSKLVTCLSGSIVDVIVDLRIGSPTFGENVCVELSALNGRSVFLGAGLGHGFMSLTNNTVVSYILDSEYSAEREYEINPMDSDLKIDWGMKNPEKLTITLSEKDQNAPTLEKRISSNLLPLYAEVSNIK